MAELLLYLRIATDDSEPETTLSITNSTKSRRGSLSGALSTESKKTQTLGAEFRRQLKDLMGNRVHSSHFESGDNSFQHSVQLTEALPTGVYFLVIQNKNKIQKATFVVE